MMNDGRDAMRVTVIGAGNGGLALAGDLALKGIVVRLYEHPDLASDFAPVREAHRIAVVDGADGSERAAALECATHDLDEALDGAEFVNVIVPVSVQERFFAELLPRLGRGRPLVLWAGRFGSLRFRKLAGAARDGHPVIEVNTLPYGCRRIGPTSVRIAFRAIKAYAAGAPREGARAVLGRLRSHFPVLVEVDALLEAALRNSGTPMLGVGAMLNVGGIESAAGQFALFRDGMTPGVRQAIRGVHGEIIAVAKAWGIVIAPYDDAVYDHATSIEGANFRDAKGGYDGFRLLTGPDQMYHRYTVENIRYGFALIAALGRRKDVTTPLLDGFVALANAVCGPEFAKLGWTPDDLDLTDTDA